MHGAWHGILNDHLADDIWKCTHAQHPRNEVKCVTDKALYEVTVLPGPAVQPCQGLSQVPALESQTFACDKDKRILLPKAYDVRQEMHIIAVRCEHDASSRRTVAAQSAR